MRSSSSHSGTYHHIPTTIITGFLGSGKTTAINHLIANKPARERWAVLVNEFGSVGVDASLIAPREEIVVREIAGGCLCCTAGASFETALNRLIRDTSPQRVLIEPTGIGHPLKIIRALSSGYYREVLDLKGTICLVDARKLGDSRYREHPSFQDQLNLADIVIGNKADCYSAEDHNAFLELAESALPAKSVISEITYGQLDLRLLDIERNESRIPVFPDAHQITGKPFLPANSINNQHNETKAPDSKKWSVHEGNAEGYYTGSWSIGSGYRFSETTITALLKTLPFERIKGVMLCQNGWISINGGEGQLTFSSCNALDSSRLELMDTTPLHCHKIDQQLRNSAAKP
ncbi:MAG: GTP-binding protein [Chlorobiaceae bacterium]|nr:GTP-binding protein [Chlorobiaceae bacterium]